MKTLNAFIVLLAIWTAAHSAPTDGEFLFSNLRAPPRIGAANGPFAGPGIWGQMLVGTNTESLTPVAMPREHFGNGHLSGPTISVPGIEGGTYVYIQLVAWNGLQWGTSLSGVPNDQLGRTDIVGHYLSYSFQPSFVPAFTESAIVPIPEPSTVALAVIGAGGFWLATRRRRRK